jgi:predicted transcriptional regulator
MTRSEAVMVALPGTSEEIAAKARMGIAGVRMTLRSLVEDGTVVKTTRWTSKHVYTFVYERGEEPSSRKPS